MTEDAKDTNQIVERSAEFLIQSGGAGQAEWVLREAWDTLWYGDWDPDEHFNAISQLLGRVRHDDDTLWMIADGPVSMLLTNPRGVELLAAAAQRDPVIRRVLELTKVP